ncbi:unnamed protein product [Larinioides sclopetarius]|uniref:Uncharacterized protein n=1 Tax=Larinioides sclopetarius TaxID=280406 RepID=A0AAV1ZX65_9ARAC
MLTCFLNLDAAVFKFWTNFKWSYERTFNFKILMLYTANLSDEGRRTESFHHYISRPWIKNF